MGCWKLLDVTVLFSLCKRWGLLIFFHDVAVLWSEGVASSPLYICSDTNMPIIWSFDFNWSLTNENWSSRCVINLSESLFWLFVLLSYLANNSILNELIFFKLRLNWMKLNSSIRWFLKTSKSPLLFVLLAIVFVTWRHFLLETKLHFPELLRFKGLKFY